MKLIDKDALVAWAKETYLCENASMIRKVCYKQLLEHLDSLDAKEVDLEKEIETHLKDCLDVKFPTTDIELIKKDVAYTAKKFFELGLRYKSSLASIPNIDDTLKEMGVDPDSKEAKSFKESYYRALDKFKAHKEE